MGLCKCPKKKVTNLFCFEHRVNVCEHCLVCNHAKCIVQSYLQWLQDSDYDPTCRLCGKNLSAEEAGPCVRLMCYDVFHWSCLDEYARRLPSNTAPAGYACPMCKNGLFPANNVASPVAEVLREILAKVNWARAGLGLPLIEEAPPPAHQVAAAGDQPTVAGMPDVIGPSITTVHGPQIHSTPALQNSQVTNMGLTNTVSGFDTQVGHAPGSSPHSVISVEDPTPYTRVPDGLYSDQRKLFDSTKGDLLNVSQDHDEDKYKRRPALQWFSRWFQSRSDSKRRDPNARFKRFAVILVLGLLGFLTVLVIFMRLGREAADNDPFLDPMANPNIRVKDEEVIKDLQAS